MTSRANGQPDVGREGASSKASIIVPAHNEEATIARLLTTLSDAAVLAVCDVFVICSGCDDHTAAVARRFEHVTIAECPSGKTLALNHGDELARDRFPRLYLDADVEVDVASILRLLDVLDTEEVAVAGPRVRFDFVDRPYVIRRYYEALDVVPKVAAWRSCHLAGRGVYGASRNARRRFGPFPLIRADDAFFDLQFSLDEVHVEHDAVVVVAAPQNLRLFLRQETRVASGNRELQMVASPRVVERQPLDGAWIGSWRSPHVSQLLIFLGVHFLARLRGRLRPSIRGREPWR